MGIDIRDPDQPVGTLSGGERQSAAIARAVYFGARVLILDEPTSALGVKQAGVVLKYILQARDRGVAVIFITHNPHHAYPVGDRFVILNRGRSLGTLPEIGDRPPGARPPDGRRPRARRARARACRASGRRLMRLTAAQALVRFLAEQIVERDGVEHRFFGGCFGIFGHGNVAGIGEALYERPDLLTYFQASNEQAMVHTAAGYARMRNRLGALVCTSSIGPGATNMVTGAALATVNRLPVLLRPRRRLRDPPPGSRPPAARGALARRHLGQRQLPAGVPLLRPDRAARAADAGGAAGHARARQPGRDRGGHARVPAGRPGGGVGLPGRVPGHARLARSPRPPRRGFARGGRGADPRGPAAAGRRRRRGHLLGGDGRAAAARRATGIPVAETQAGKGALPFDHPCALGAIGATGTLAANRVAAEADIVIGVGTRWTDFTTASKTAFRNPRRPLRERQRGRLRCGEALRPRARRRRASRRSRRWPTLLAGRPGRAGISGAGCPSE